MILRAYIHIGPPARSLLTPREDEGFAFAAALTEEWNANCSPKITVPGHIALDKDSPPYRALRTLFLTRAKGVDPEAVQWHESPTAVYSTAELLQCEVLTLHTSGEAGWGGTRTRKSMRSRLPILRFRQHHEATTGPGRGSAQGPDGHCVHPES